VLECIARRLLQTVYFFVSANCACILFLSLALQATIGELSGLIEAEERKEKALLRDGTPEGGDRSSATGGGSGKGGKGSKGGNKGEPVGMSQEEVLSTLHHKVHTQACIWKESPRFSLLYFEYVCIRLRA